MKYRRKKRERREREGKGQGREWEGQQISKHSWQLITLSLLWKWQIKFFSRPLS